jgi:hypothetical protein
MPASLDKELLSRGFSWEGQLLELSFLRSSCCHQHWGANTVSCACEGSSLRLHKAQAQQVELSCLFKDAYIFQIVETVMH